MFFARLCYSLLALAVILSLSTTYAQEEAAAQEVTQPPEIASENVQAVEQEQTPSERAGLGVTLGIDEHSVFVKFAYPNSPAALSGIRSGARIHEINEQTCDTVAKTIDMIQSFQPGETVDFRISQDGQFHMVAVTFSTVAAAFGAEPLQNQDTVNRLDESAQKIQALEQRVGSLATLANQVKTLTEQVKTEGDQKIAALSKTIADHATSTDTKLAAMQKTFTDEMKLRDVKLVALEKAIVDGVKAGDVKIADLKKAVDALRTLPNGLTKAENEIATLKQTATTVDASLASLTKKIQTLQGKIATLNKPAPVVQQPPAPPENKSPEPSQSENNAPAQPKPAEPPTAAPATPGTKAPATPEPEPSDSADSTGNP